MATISPFAAQRPPSRLPATDPLMNPGWPDSPAPPDFLAQPPPRFRPDLEDKLRESGFHDRVGKLREAQVDLSLAVSALATERASAFGLLAQAERAGLGKSFVAKFESSVQDLNRKLWNLEVRAQRLLESAQPTAGQVDALLREHAAVLWTVGEVRPLLEDVRNFATVPLFRDLPGSPGGSGLLPLPSAPKPGSAVPQVTITCADGSHVTVPIGTGNACQDRGGSADNPNDN